MMQLRVSDAKSFIFFFLSFFIVVFSFFFNLKDFSDLIFPFHFVKLMTIIKISGHVYSEKKEALSSFQAKILFLIFDDDFYTSLNSKRIQRQQKCQ